MIDWTQFTDDLLAQRQEWLGKQIAALYEERTEVWLEQTRRRVNDRYAIWRDKKSDIEFDYDNEALAQGVDVKTLVR